MRVLFICNMNLHRSPTAERVFSDRFETRSAGLYGGKMVDADALSWADLVAVMDDAQRAEIGKRFPRQYLAKRIVSLDIPDVFARDQPELISLLESRMAKAVVLQ